MHASVRARLEMIRMVREIGILAVFDYEPSVFFQYALAQDGVRQSRELLQGVRRVRENQIILGPARTEELEYVASDNTQIADA